MKSIGVFLCCNDQHGSFEGCVRSLRIGDAVLQLEAIALDRPPRISFLEFDHVTRIVRISGRVFPVRTYRHCTSHLTADHVSMESFVVAELLNFLKSKGAFEATGGTSPVFESWQHEGELFSAQGLEAFCL